MWTRMLLIPSSSQNSSKPTRNTITWTTYTPLQNGANSSPRLVIHHKQTLPENLWNFVPKSLCPCRALQDTHTRTPLPDKNPTSFSQLSDSKKLSLSLSLCAVITHWGGRAGGWILCAHSLTRSELAASFIPLLNSGIEGKGWQASPSSSSSSS